MPRSSRFRLPLAGVLLIVASALASCVPQVSHGPRVVQGARYFVSSAVVHASQLQNENVSLLPTMYVGGARGWVQSERSRAFSLGLQVPVYLLPIALESASLEGMLATSFLDVYGQPQRAAVGGLDYGAGALLSTGMAMPYVQLGRAGDGGWYTTQAVAFTYRALNGGHYWMPAVAFRGERADGSRGVDFYLSAAIGKVDSRSEWFVSAGVVADFARRR